MGSSGSGRISDYPGSGRPSSGGNGDGSDGAPGGGGSGQSGEDRCGLAFEARLEDVEHSDCFAATGAPLPIGAELRVRLRKRLVAETTAGQSVGNLPTSLNYLAGCLKDGWTYVGRVTVSRAGPPVAVVSADFAPIPPP